MDKKRKYKQNRTNNRQCPHCGRSMRAGNYKRHERACARVPDGDELAARLTNDETATVYGFAQRYDVGVNIIYGKLESTEWTRAKLKTRGQRVAANGRARQLETHRKNQQRLIDSGAKFCHFCEIGNGLVVCVECKKRLAHFAETKTIPVEWQTRLIMAYCEGLLSPELHEAFEWIENEFKIVSA